MPITLKSNFTLLIIDRDLVIRNTAVFMLRGTYQGWKQIDENIL